MKLFIAPGACSMSCHIAFEESKIQFEPVLSAWDNKPRWDEINALNPQGAVPVLQLDDGKVLTQNIAILSYVAERSPDSNLLPKTNTLDRAQTFQWLSWVAADLHKAFGPLFNDAATPEAKSEAQALVNELLAQAEKHMEGRMYLAGSNFTIADAYFFTVYNWTKPASISTDAYRNLNAYAARIAERPAVRAVLRREGLLKNTQ